MSSRGDQYIFTLYDYNPNVILIAPLKTKQIKEISTVFTTCFERLTKHGHKVELQVLDNERSDVLKAALEKVNVAFQLVPSHIYRRNTAERGIHTCKKSSTSRIDNL